MPLASRVGIDTAVGLITGGGQTVVKINGQDWSVVGDAIASHGTGPHAAATMAAGSAFVSINGVAVCRAGDAATCGDTSTGSGPVATSS